MSNRIGIDLGGTKIDAITLSATGETLFEKRVATPKTYEGRRCRDWGAGA